MWQLYERLIESVNEAILVEEVITGIEFTVVKSTAGLGFTRTIPERRFPFSQEPLPGMKLKTLCRSIQSWNLMEAGIGAAALTAYYNGPESPTANKLKLGKRASDFFPSDSQSVKALLAGREPALLPELDRLFLLSQAVEKPFHEEYPLTAVPFVAGTFSRAFLAGETLVTKRMVPLLTCFTPGTALPCGLGIPLSEAFFQQGAQALLTYRVMEPESFLQDVRWGKPEQALLSHCQPVMLTADR